ncbi:hypothetical protein [Chitinophaga qingshengii]|uniref:GIY-YIG nuclease family protein n=1 Tax=Chitinophaga qingshengii TaxID=1569794 RepID=A0ABR7TG13_9BACT|nr:hypothetical protein [Chitinophaga qingshengii]MBC9929284.1 hypothetical protein [Chitinophaga qingshengii]
MDTELHSFFPMYISEDIRSMVMASAGSLIAGKENLSDIPAIPAVYAICARVNGRPANCRFIGETDDLKKSLHHHFGEEEQSRRLYSFMRSAKQKVLIYLPMDGEEPAKRCSTEKYWKEKIVLK